MAFSSIYEFEYYDDEGVLNECVIQKEDGGFPVVPTQINGYVTYSMSEVDSVDESIRGGGLTLSLEASTTQTYSDLYSGNEKQFLVYYYRDSVLKLKGWLISDGIYEDFVSDKWIIDIDVTDGLSFLKDLAYVDTSGLQYTGKQSQLEIISNCLLRTGLGQNINTNIDIYYTGLSTTLDVLDNVFYNTDRFVKDDGETIMDCEEVLRDVLEPYNAQIVSWNGEWWIFKINQLFADDTPTFFQYNFLGTSYGTTTTEDFSFDLGSQIDSYYPHHCNSNQVISYNKSIGAYRINYKYGLDLSLLENVYLAHSGGTISEWTINSSTNLTLNTSGYGVDLDFDATASVKNLTSNTIAVLADDLINYNIKFKTTSLTKNTTTLFWGKFNYKVVLTGGSTYYFNPFAVPAEWTLTDTTAFSFGGELNSNTEILVDLPAAPIAGNITIEIWTPEQTNDETGTFYLNYISVSPQGESTSDGLKQGEFHTFQRKNNPSTNVKDTKTVNVGDQPSDLYYGTIYKADETTPTETWFRKGVTEAKVILELMGEETMMLSQDTSREFTGDVYGFVEPLSIVTINNVSGLFIPLSLDYNSKTNITNVKLRQIFNATLSDLDYELTYDYGNSVKPTIKG